MWFLGSTRKRKRRRSKRSLLRRSPAHSAHYLEHKERARSLVHERLTYWNKFYEQTYGRVAIRNTRSRWGSCSSKGNLNFNYKLIFLPIELVDYVIVHELCHLIEFNHSPVFWEHVARTIPDHPVRRYALRTIPVSRRPGAQSMLAPQSRIEYSTPHYGTTQGHSPC